MLDQRYQTLDRGVVDAFLKARSNGSHTSHRLQLSWSNWGFGSEPLHVSAARLASNDIRFIELHGNRYGPDLGYRTSDTRRVLSDHGITVAGICGMFTSDQELASNRPTVRQVAMDYLRRQVDFCAEMGGSYVLVAPGAVGRTVQYDANEFERAADTLALVADYFQERSVRATIEPIRPEETSLVHTLDQARDFIARVGHPSVQWINADLYHMLAGEVHIGRAILEHGSMINNLHMADTNRRGLGQGILDLDIVIMALYAVGHNASDRYCTPEPLGAGGNPYQAMYGRTEPSVLDELVSITAKTFIEREALLLAVGDEELSRARFAYDPRM